MTQQKLIAEPDARTLITRRLVDAPRSLVFEAFTEPEYIKRWMGPRSLTFVHCESDLRVGGTYRFVHRAADGQDFVVHGTYCEIVRPERIVRTSIFERMPERVAIETQA